MSLHLHLSDIAQKMSEARDLIQKAASIVGSIKNFDIETNTISKETSSVGHKPGRDQYQDQTNPAHNVGQVEVQQAFAIAQEHGKTPMAAYAEFDDAGGWKPAYPGNSDAAEGVGTTNLQEFTRLISQGHTDPNGHQHSGPTAVIISVDNGVNWYFASDIIASAAEGAVMWGT